VFATISIRTVSINCKFTVIQSISPSLDATKKQQKMDELDEDEAFSAQQKDNLLTSDKKRRPMLVQRSPSVLSTASSKVSSKLFITAADTPQASARSKSSMASFSSTARRAGTSMSMAKENWQKRRIYEKLVLNSSPRDDVIQQLDDQEELLDNEKRDNEFNDIINQFEHSLNRLMSNVRFPPIVEKSMYIQSIEAT